MSNWNWNCCSITCYGCVGWLGPDQSSSSRAPSWLSTGLVVTRGLLVFIRSFNKFSPVTNIYSSKFAVFRVKFDPWVGLHVSVEPRTSLLSYVCLYQKGLCPSVSLEFSSLSLNYHSSHVPSSFTHPSVYPSLLYIYLRASVPLGCILLIIMSLSLLDALPLSRLTISR